MTATDAASSDQPHPHSADEHEEPSPAKTVMISNKAKTTAFGAEGGAEVTNKSRILSSLDTALGVSHPPALEYIVALPFASISIFGWGITYNAYGHSVVRYTLPSGEQKIMNIVDRPTGGIVHFTTPEDYFFSTHSQDGRGGEQRGLYNRDYISVRLEEVPAEAILKMHAYFELLSERSRESKVAFDILFDPVFSTLSKVLPGGLRERGNCARWTSRGMVEAGLLKQSSMWPKSIWIELMETADPSNYHVISYRRIRHAFLSYGVNASGTFSAIAPLQSIRTFVYGNTESFAHAVVEVPDGQTDAVITIQPHPKGQSYWRYQIFNSSLFILASVIFTGYALHRYNRMMTSHVYHSLYETWTSYWYRNWKPPRNKRTSEWLARVTKMANDKNGDEKISPMMRDVLHLVRSFNQQLEEDVIKQRKMSGTETTSTSVTSSTSAATSSAPTPSPSNPSSPSTTHISQTSSTVPSSTTSPHRSYHTSTRQYRYMHYNYIPRVMHRTTPLLRSSGILLKLCHR